MRKNVYLLLSILFIFTILIGACQPKPAAGVDAAPVMENNITDTVEPEAPAATAEATQVAEALVSPIVTLDPVQKDLEQAEAVARDYFNAVVDGNSRDAADLLSRFSLMVFEITREDAVNELQLLKAQSITWSGLEIDKVEAFNDESILVYVTYMVSQPGEEKTTPSATQASEVVTETVKDVWAIRLENKEWLLNWKNIIDFKTLASGSKTVNGVTVLPTQLLRFTDRIELAMLIQNRNNGSVVFGQANETLGTFYFGETAVTAEKTQMILNALRSYPDQKLEIKGLYEAYPDRIEIRKWNNYQVDPWYNFLLN